MEYINKKRNDKHEKILPIKSQKNVNAKQVCQKISIIQEDFKMKKYYITKNKDTGTLSVLEVDYITRTIHRYVNNLDNINYKIIKTGNKNESAKVVSRRTRTILFKGFKRDHYTIKEGEPV